VPLPSGQLSTGSQKKNVRKSDGCVEVSRPRHQPRRPVMRRRRGRETLAEQSTAHRSHSSGLGNSSPSDHTRRLARNGFVRRKLRKWVRPSKTPRMGSSVAGSRRSIPFSRGKVSNRRHRIGPFVNSASVVPPRWVPLGGGRAPRTLAGSAPNLLQRTAAIPLRTVHSITPGCKQPWILPEQGGPEGRTLLKPNTRDPVVPVFIRDRLAKERA
jgi:hypothetical protein